MLACRYFLRPSWPLTLRTTTVPMTKAKIRANVPGPGPEKPKSWSTALIAALKMPTRIVKTTNDPNHFKNPTSASCCTIRGPEITPWSALHRFPSRQRQEKQNCDHETDVDRYGMFFIFPDCFDPNRYLQINYTRNLLVWLAF
jgi:hypothetical protein